MGRLQRVFARPFTVSGEDIFLSASCGVAVHPNGGADAQRLQEHAHTAMRAAKELGGGGYEIFDPLLAEEGSSRLWLAREIRDGIERGGFALYYQPLVDLATMRVEAVEALARWEHPQRGLVSPAQFIPLAEESDLIVALGRHLRAQACAQLKSWQQTLAWAPRLAINVRERACSADCRFPKLKSGSATRCVRDAIVGEHRVRHNLKIDDKWLTPVASGQKKAEIRRADRDFSDWDARNTTARVHQTARRPLPA